MLPSSALVTATVKNTLQYTRRFKLSCFQTTLQFWSQCHVVGIGCAGIIEPVALYY